MLQCVFTHSREAENFQGDRTHGTLKWEAVEQAAEVLFCLP